MPCDIMYGNMHNVLPQSYRCYCAYVDHLRTTMVDSYEIASECLKTAALRQKQTHNADTVPRQFNEGDGYCSTENSWETEHFVVGGLDLMW